MITKEDMINSLDACELKRKSLFNIVAILLILFIESAYCVVNHDFDIFLYALLLMLLFTCPLWISSIYYYNKRKNIINNYHNYVEHTTTLDVSNPSLMYKHYVYYTVTFEHNGRMITIDTYPLFGRGLFVKYKH